MSRLICGRHFSKCDDARGGWLKSLLRRYDVIRIVTSCHGDRTAACLNELSLKFKLLVIEKISQSYC